MSAMRAENLKWELEILKWCEDSVEKKTAILKWNSGVLKKNVTVREFALNWVLARSMR